MSQRYPRERSTDKEIPGYKTVQTAHDTEPYKTVHDITTVWRSQLTNNTLPMAATHKGMNTAIAIDAGLLTV